MEDTKTCKTCKQEKNIEDFTKYYGKKKRTVRYRPHCKKCKYINYKENLSAKRREKIRKYQREYHLKNPENAKIKSYQHIDRKNKRKSIKLREAKDLILNGDCFYCGETEKACLGLDRIDNRLGHEKTNVKVCCEKCNNLLSDIPYEAKLELKKGLTSIRKKGFLKEWIIPTKRNNKKKKR